ncbi:unnamed protein product [Colias eurytheme]|nr:unnamed protein product [Colias eurytheme]
MSFNPAPFNNDDSSKINLDNDRQHDSDDARTRRTRAGGLSKSSSANSMVDMQSHETGRLWRKRSLDRSRSGSDSEDGFGGSKTPCQKTSKRGKGRTPGTCAARRAAKLDASRKLETELQAEQEVAECAERIEAMRASAPLPPIPIEEGNTAEALSLRIADSLAAIEKVRSRSNNLKTTFKKVLKLAHDDIELSVAQFKRLTVSEETRLLQADNSRLQAEIDFLKRELEKVKTSQSVQVCPQPREPDADLVASILRQVGDMINARFEALEERLPPAKRLRPALAADNRRATVEAVQQATQDLVPLPQSTKKTYAMAASLPQPSTSATGSAPQRAVKRAAVPVAKTALKQQVAVQVAATAMKPKPKANKKKKVASKSAANSKPASIVAPSTSAPSSDPLPQQQPEEGWTVVGKGGKKTKRAKAKKPAAQSRKKRHKLHVPSSSAVVLTLQPGAEERGITYAKIMMEARRGINLGEMGIDAMRFKRGVTGARILEIPGASSTKEADALAAKLREVLGEVNVKVTRPVKCAELRITGLDDSASAEDIATAVSRAGECSVEHVKCGALRSGPRGAMSAWVSCPVTAAKKVAQVGRVLVGWVSASVSLIEQKPLRCFRCQELGHVSATCSSLADRSTICFRCGEMGHKAGECSATTAHCALCAEAKRPAEHRLGSLACKAPKPKKGGMRKLDGARAPSRSALVPEVPGSFTPSLAEWEIDVAIVSEPYNVPAWDNWAGDLDSLVTLVAQGGTQIEQVVRRRGCVSAVINGYTVVGVYFSPNRCLADFEEFLVVLRDMIDLAQPLPVLLAGDFNAKSVSWGCRAGDVRGTLLADWAVASGLTLINRGTELTCVRQRGGSIVDVTFASPPLARCIQDWRVLVDVETLSDHRYIRFSVSTPSTANSRFPAGERRPRWALGTLDKELLIEAAIVQAWLPTPQGDDVDVEEEATWLANAMAQICDASMRRARSVPRRRQMYWWSADISQLRASCVAARRAYTRHRRRRRRDEEEEARLYAVYRDCIVTLQDAIGTAKTRAWEEMLEDLNHEPWGRPYKRVRQKLRPWAPPLSQTLEPRFLEQVVTSLFPNRGRHSPPPMASTMTVQEEYADGNVPVVTRDELAVAVERLKAKKTAPGPDARLIDHLEGVGPDLSENQFGFRRGRSTIDAIAALRDLADNVADEGGVLLAVSLDIANAFNTLPWSCVIEALRYHNVPEYMLNTLKLCQCVMTLALGAGAVNIPSNPKKSA